MLHFNVILIVSRTLSPDRAAIYSRAGSGALLNKYHGVVDDAVSATIELLVSETVSLPPESTTSGVEVAVGSMVSAGGGGGGVGVGGGGEFCAARTAAS